MSLLKILLNLLTQFMWFALLLGILSSPLDQQTTLCILPVDYKVLHYKKIGILLYLIHPFTDSTKTIVSVTDLQTQLDSHENKE